MVTKQGGGVSTQTLDKSQLLHIYEQMKTIREFEERASKEFALGKLPGFVHLYAGEEAVAAGVYAHPTDEDYITSHHPGQEHRPAKGVRLPASAAQLLGPDAAASRAKGGSNQL